MAQAQQEYSPTNYLVHQAFGRATSAPHHHHHHHTTIKHHSIGGGGGSSSSRNSIYENSDNDPDGLKDEEDPELKRQKFLERNRLAASKCRQKKKVWMQQLTEEAEQAASRNKALQMMVIQLKDEVLVLKNQLLAHQKCNCYASRDSEPPGSHVPPSNPNLLPEPMRTLPSIQPNPLMTPVDPITGRLVTPDTNTNLYILPPPRGRYRS